MALQRQVFGESTISAILYSLVKTDPTAKSAVKRYRTSSSSSSDFDKIGGVDSYCLKSWNVASHSSIQEKSYFFFNKANKGKDFLAKSPYTF